MKRLQIARLSALLCLLVIVTSLFVFMRTTAHAASNVGILAFNGNLAATTNSIYPDIEVTNTGTTAISLSSLTVRYYYTEDGTQAQNFWCDFSTIGSANVTGTFGILSTPVTGADHFLQIGFTSAAGSLAPGATVQAMTRFAKSDWSNYSQANDYSFNAAATSFVSSTKVTGYIAGALISGTEPSGLSATPTPTIPITPTATPIQTTTPIPTPTGNEPNIDRFFAPGTPVSTMISMASSMTQQQVKVLVEQQVQEYWSVIQSTFGFTTLNKAYAFFLGITTRESTFQGGLETGGSSLGSGTSGSGASGHSYGPLQAAETAYLNTNTGYQTEFDVPQIFQYDLVPANFYDIGISIHMGIRHLIHFAHMASTAGETGINIVRFGLAGYNTGQVINVGSGELTSYSDEIGALAGWYLNNNHLFDTIWSWTGDPRVDRSNPWGWY